MLKKRLIPILLLQNGMLVRSEGFSIHQVIGNPIHEVKRFNEWNVDELVYLDITQSDLYDIRRADTKTRELSNPMEILREVSENCFMPLTWGGRITSVDQMRQCFANGADKIVINSAAVRNPALISMGASMFGSQAIVVSIDVLCQAPGKYEVYIDGGRTATGLSIEDWVRKVEIMGAGEVLVQNIERDGKGCGYDLDLISKVASIIKIPLIACSGVGDYRHYAQGIQAGASAVAAANIWHFKEMSDRNGKRAMARAGINIRIAN